MSGSVSQSKKITSLEVVDNMLVRSEIAYFSGTVNADGIITNNIVVTNGIETTEVILKEPSPGSNTITLQSPDLSSGSYSLTFPTDDGAASQMLTTDGMGNLSWSSASGGGDVFGPASSTNNAITVFDQTSGKMLRNSGVIVDSNDNVLVPNTITVSGVTSSGSIRSNTSIIMEDPGAGLNTVTLQSPTLATGSYSLTLPVDDGTASQVLTTDGSGILSWTTPSGGGTPGGSDTQIQFNNSGSFGGDSAFTWNTSTDTMTLGAVNSTAIIKGTDRSGTGEGTSINIDAGKNLTGDGNGGNLNLSAGYSFFNGGIFNDGGDVTISDGFGSSPPRTNQGKIKLTTHGGLEITKPTYAVVSVASDVDTGLICETAATNTVFDLAASDVKHTSYKTPIIHIQSALNTVGNASTIYIEGPPTNTGAGTLTNSYSLLVESGESRFETISLTDPGAGSNAVTIQSPTLSTGSYSLTLPIDDGNASEVLTTDGSGNLSWAASGGTPGGSNTEIQFNDDGALGGNIALTFDKSTTTVSLGAENTTATLSSVTATTSDTDGGSLLIKSGNGLGTGSRGKTDIQGNVRINYFGTEAETVLNSNWTTHDTASGPDFKNINTLVWSPSLNLFVSIFQNTASVAASYATSSDGTSWGASAVIDDKNWWDMIWVDSDAQFVAIANENPSSLDAVLTSPDGTTWTTRNASSAEIWLSLVHSTTTGRYVAVGTDNVSVGKIMYSPDAITWTAATFPASPGVLQSVARSSTTYSAVGSTGGSYNIATSSDGITWTSTNNASIDFTSVTWASTLSLFYASTTVGGNHRIATSADGFTWATISATNIEATAGQINWVPELEILTLSGTQTKYSSDGSTFIDIPNVTDGNAVAYSESLKTLVFTGPNQDFSFMQTSDTTQLEQSVTIGTTDFTPNVIINAPLFLNNSNTGAGTTLQVLGTGEVVEQVSLRAYKQDEIEIQNETGYLVEDVLKLKPKFFTWKETGIRDLGFVVEDAIEANQAYIYRDEVLGIPKNVKDRSILAGLVAMVKKQQTEIEVLKNEINKVKSYTGYSEV